MLSKCKDSNAFTKRVLRDASFVPFRTGERRLPTVRRDRRGIFYGASGVLGNSIRRNVLPRPLGSVALRVRGAYLFEVDGRPVLERARP